jgi:hypothetical protein
VAWVKMMDISDVLALIIAALCYFSSYSLLIFLIKGKYELLHRDTLF